ncbi:MAG: hypothetical protein IJN63_05915 [Clostridia bacterium]|nr:hypothetical protein [Clostridia bacterium]
METLSYKCPACDAALKYDGKADRMTCEYCGSNFDVESVKAYNDDLKKRAEEAEREQEEERPEEDNVRSSDKEWNEDEKEQVGAFTCPTCGGELLFDEHTVASSCPYCGNPAMVKHRLSGELKPELVLPFRITKEEAKAALRRFTAKKLLLPKGFADENRIESIRGIYLPFWLYTGKADAMASYSATRVFTTRTPKYDVVRTDHYRLDRRGKVSFSNLPIDGSSTIDDALMDSIEPFDFSSAEEFTTAYLAGFMANKYDMTCDDCVDRAKERMRGSAESLLASTVTGYSTTVKTNSAVSFSDVDAKYALLPAWLLVTKYKGKNYTFAMNGQTGKFVGKLPVSAKRFWLYTLLFGLGISAVLFIIYVLLFFGGMI